MSKSKKIIYGNDEKILNVLLKDARMSLVDISEKTGISRQTVQKTINKLESENILWGYHAIVDEQKIGNLFFLLLIKRTVKPLDDKIAEKIISRNLEERASSIGVKIVTSIYTHGIYDWIISFVTTDIMHAKKFTEFVKVIYKDYIDDVHLIESLFFVKKQGHMNPEVNKLKQFV